MQTTEGDEDFARRLQEKFDQEACLGVMLDDGETEDKKGIGPSDHQLSDSEDSSDDGSESGVKGRIDSPRGEYATPISTELALSVGCTQSTSSVMSEPSGDRPLCKYGSKCYRKNPVHLAEFQHPEKEPPEKISGDLSGRISEPPLKKRKSEDSVGKRLDSIGKKVDSSETKGDSKLTRQPFPKRLEESSPYNFFLNKIYSLKKTHEEPLSLVFLDILNPSLGEIVQSAQLNFMVDLNFLMMNYRAARLKDKPLLIMYGELDGDPKDYSEITCSKVTLPFQYGTHHTKMMLLEYTSGMRAVLHTANLIPDDWYEKTQGFWISPLFPRLDGDKQSLLEGESPTQFKKDLVDYLLFYKSKHLDKWISVIKKHDFSSCNVVFVASTPAFHLGEAKNRWGHMKLRKTLQQHCSGWKPSRSRPVIVQCSSIGSLGKDARSWMTGELGASLCGSDGSSSVLPEVRVIYPSEEDVKNSSQGYEGGSCLPYRSATHSKQEWLSNHLHLWRSECKNRTRSMPHIKTYSRLLEGSTSYQYLLLTSANLSKAAWGQLQKNGSQLFIRSYEAGVLLLPKFVTGSEEFKLGGGTAECGFFLPYDVPLTHYASNMKPWFMDTPKSDPDILGSTYP